MNIYKNYTNAELNIKLKNLENEYESNKNKIMDIIKNMHELDVQYAEVKKEIKNRSIGLWQ